MLGVEGTHPQFLEGTHEAKGGLFLAVSCPITPSLPLFLSSLRLQTGGGGLTRGVDGGEGEESSQITGLQALVCSCLLSWG